MNSKLPIHLHCPKLWKDLYDPEPKNDQRPSLKEHAAKHKLDLVVDFTLDVVETDDGKTYQNWEQDKGKVHVFVLPAPHCAIVKSSLQLHLLGPAIATRNDIFAFRKRHPTKKPQLGDDRFHFRIGVKEKHITTTDVSRIILRKWSPDIYVFADPPPNGALSWYQPHQQIVESFCANGIKHFEYSDPTERLDMLCRDDVDVAIFMGSELDAVFDHRDLIDVANLNQLIGSIYDIHMFPRAVYASFHDQEAVPFIQCVNSFVQSHLPADSPPLREQRVARLCHTGPDSDVAEVNSLIRFTNDIFDKLHAKYFDNDFERSERQKRKNARPFKPADFVGWKTIYARELRRQFSELIAEMQETLPRVIGRRAVDATRKDEDDDCLQSFLNKESVSPPEHFMAAKEIEKKISSTSLSPRAKEIVVDWIHGKRGDAKYALLFA